ncbi:hypothetical protein C5708_03240 [Caulobacter sp. CCUG 60055]|nr:DUF6481 family protein [Caulobacter sp. CCUG 60055]MBQ1540872.1 hypothetical protein [Caulobacteraceae bacterium]MCI3179259.1 hypothetical protein [Caulobacter sp. CCUG 60055]
MKHLKTTGFAERREASAEAKKALLAKFKPKPAVTANDFVDRATERERELDAVRAARQAEREAARAARAAAVAAEQEAQAALEQAALEVKRSERKERKALEKSEAQARRASRLAAYGRM